MLLLGGLLANSSKKLTAVLQRMYSLIVITLNETLNCQNNIGTFYSIDLTTSVQKLLRKVGFYLHSENVKPFSLVRTTYWLSTWVMEDCLVTHRLDYMTQTILEPKEETFNAL